MSQSAVNTFVKWILCALIGIGIGQALHSGGFGCAASAIALLYTGIKAEE